MVFAIRGLSFVLRRRWSRSTPGQRRRWGRRRAVPASCQPSVTRACHSAASGARPSAAARCRRAAALRHRVAHLVQDLLRGPGTGRPPSAARPGRAPPGRAGAVRRRALSSPTMPSTWPTTRRTVCSETSIARASAFAPRSAWPSVSAMRVGEAAHPPRRCAGRWRRTRSTAPHLGGDDGGEAAAVGTGARRLDGGIDRQQVGLARDLGHVLSHRAQLGRTGGQRAHRLRHRVARTHEGLQLLDQPVQLRFAVGQQAGALLQRAGIGGCRRSPRGVQLRGWMASKPSSRLAVASRIWPCACPGAGSTGARPRPAARPSAGPTLRLVAGGRRGPLDPGGAPPPAARGCGRGADGGAPGRGLRCHGSVMGLELQLARDSSQNREIVEISDACSSSPMPRNEAGPGAGCDFFPDPEGQRPSWPKPRRPCRAKVERRSEIYLPVGTLPSTPLT